MKLSDLKKMRREKTVKDRLPYYQEFNQIRNSERARDMRRGASKTGR